MIDHTFNKNNMHQATINILTKASTQTPDGIFLYLINDLINQIKEKANQGLNNVTFECGRNRFLMDLDGNIYGYDSETGDLTTDKSRIDMSAGVSQQINEEHIINYFKGLGYSIIDNRIVTDLEIDDNFVPNTKYFIKTGNITIAW